MKRLGRITLGLSVVAVLLGVSLALVTSCTAHAEGYEKFKVTAKDKFGKEQTYFTGRLPADLSKEMRRSFLPKFGKYAFQDIPKEYDLRPYAQRIFRQQCGDCWAQGAVSLFETLISLRDNKSTYISRQNVIDCSGSGSCGGGYLTSIKHFVKPKGAIYEQDYPYKGSNQKCQSGKPIHEMAESAFFMEDDATWPEYQRAVLETGPLEVCGASSSLGNGGWVSKNSGGSIDHCYALVGWLDGATHGKPAGSYSIILNSWGTNWGDKGYGYYLMAKDGVHMDGNVIVEGGGLVYKAACSPQPVANAGKEKSILVEGN